jgi:hypothetical protein
VFLFIVFKRPINKNTHTPLNKRLWPFAIGEGSVRRLGLSMFEKCLGRHEYKYNGREDLNVLTPLDFNWCWEAQSDALRRFRAAGYVVRVFLQFNRNPGHDEYEDFCWTRLMLYHPFDSPEELDLSLWRLIP